MTKFDFLKLLKQIGCKTDSYSQMVFYATGDRCYYRCLDGKTLEIGVKKCFDRWANSIDFTCKVPKDVKGFDALMLALDDCIKNERYDIGVGQALDIDFLVRKARRGKL
jgi:hypothetical protein